MKFSRCLLLLMLLMLSACSPSSKPQVSSTAEPAILVDAPTKYVEYTEAGFAQARAEGKIIYLEFSAAWCPSCSALDPLIRESIRTLNDANVVAFKVDYDTSKEMQRTYNVIYQHTHIILKSDGTVSWKSLDAQWSDELFRSEILKAEGV